MRAVPPRLAPASSGLAALLVLALAACGGGGGGGGPVGPTGPTGPTGPLTPLAGPCPVQEVPAITVDPGADLLTQLRALPDVASVEERASVIGGARFVVVSFDQPVDHCDPASPRFTQWTTLLVRGGDLPTVMRTSGYDLDTDDRRLFALSGLLGANQVSFEHRYFTRSTPASVGPTGPDWSKLDIFQAATDQHRIARNLRALLAGPWINTGGSKGGMTSVYHRAFYPDDVQATLANVAPQSFGRSDPRFATYLDAIGPEGCRQALRTVQLALLDAADGVKALMAEDAALAGDGYTRLDADPAVAFDEAYRFAVVELPFAFWQYGSEARCATIPGSGASPGELWAFLDGALLGTRFWIGDLALDFFAAYYYQSATQLGGPAYPEAHLIQAGRLPAGGAGDLPEVYTPVGVEKIFDAQAMVDVDAWVTAHGERLMFVYGGRDPWSGGQFTPGPGRDSVKYVLPLANHNTASIFNLTGADRAAAAATLSRWMGVPVILPRLAEPAGGGAVALPSDEADLPRRRRL